MSGSDYRYKLAWMAAPIFLVWAAQSSAQQPPACPEPAKAANHARKALQSGQRAMKAGTPTEALAAFQESVACEPRAAALLGMADAQAALGRLAEAHETYSRAQNAPKVTDKERKQAEAGRDVIDARTGLLRIVVDPKDSAIEVDGVARPVLSKPLRLGVGTHLVKVNKQGYRPDIREVVVDPRSNQTLAVSLAEELSTGTLSVREGMGRKGTLVVEGLPVGPLPWNGSLGPGSYRVWMESEDGASEPATVEIAVGQTTSITLTPQPRPKLVQPVVDACRIHGDCHPGKLCQQGRCTPKLGPDGEVEADALSEEGQTCGSQQSCVEGLKCLAGKCMSHAKHGEECGLRECQNHLVCYQKRCLTRQEAPFNRVPSFVGEWQVYKGMDGVDQYPGPMHSVMARFEVPIAGWLRYKLGMGYINLNADGGFRMSPANFGFPITVLNRSGHELYLEPGVEVISASLTSIDDGYFAFAMGARAVYRHKAFYLSVLPITVENVVLRFTELAGMMESMTPGGYNYGVGFGLGVVP